MRKVVLASGSPRRTAILSALGVPHEVRESGYDEEKIVFDDPIEMVEELALQKALVVAREVEDALVIGGDTTVYVEGQILTKPVDSWDAERMIRLLMGKTHRCITGVAVFDSLTGERVVGNEEGEITFRSLSEEEVKIYIESEAWRGFAGAYAVQGRASAWVVSQAGVTSAIYGMPIVLTASLLEQMGYQVETDPREVEEWAKGQKIGLVGTGNE